MVYRWKQLSGTNKQTQTYTAQLQSQGKIRHQSRWRSRTETKKDRVEQRNITPEARDWRGRLLLLSLSPPLYLHFKSPNSFFSISGYNNHFMCTANCHETDFRKKSRRTDVAGSCKTPLTSLMLKRQRSNSLDD